jgi:50S ribosomal subunit-associated GTPase HflX
MERMQAFRSGEGQKFNVGQIPGMDLIKPKKVIENTYASGKNSGRADIDIDKIPPILYIANKSEDGYEGEIMADFFRKFPQLTTAIDPVTNQAYDPIFISAEHGDGLPDLFQMIKRHIPDSK